MNRLTRRAPLRPGYWFRPKRIGWGATPATWQGWLLTLAFVALAALLGNAAEHRGEIWLLLLAPLVLGFVWLRWRKTDGEWRWRRGERN